MKPKREIIAGRAKSLLAAAGGARVVAAWLGLTYSAVWRWYPLDEIPGEHRLAFYRRAALEGADLSGVPPRQVDERIVQTIHDEGGDKICVVHYLPVDAPASNGVEVSRAALAPETAIAEGLRLAQAGFCALQRAGRGL